MSLRLIRRVQSRGGAVSLYEHKGLGLVEVTEVWPAGGATPVLEVERHPQGHLQPLLQYFADIQSYLLALEHSMPSGLGRMSKSGSKRKAGGAS
jgi:hypothetical protein